jgi:hypothetical protein
VVSAVGGATSLHVYDLDAESAYPLSFDLGARAVSPGSDSLFASQRLWLQSSYGSSTFACTTCAEDTAQVWALTDGAPVRIELPTPYHTVLPIEGAVRAGQTDEVLAVGWLRHEGGITSATLLSFRGNEVTVLGAAPTLDELMTGGFGQGRAAPAGVRGAGDANAWQIFVRGMGLPLGIEAAPPITDHRFVLAAAGVRVDGALDADASLIEAAIEELDNAPGGPGAVRPNPELVVTGGASPIRLELAPGASELIPTAAGVVAVATQDITSCQQSGRDCSGYAPGVAVFDLSGEPRLTGALPFPELPLPAGFEDHSNVSWRSYDALTQNEQTAFRLDATRLAFVAQVYLSCDTVEYCQALGLDAVPIAQAGVNVSVSETCPPSNVDPECVPTPERIPTVYGSGRRQYFYVLELDAAGAPKWQLWGTSALESSAARIEQGARFAAPLATDGMLAATRLERRSSSGEPLARGEARFMLDRFVLQPSGQPGALPPVNVPGYPLARLGASAGVERWISAEALPGETGRARLQRLDIRDDGARIERQLELDGGRFLGLRVLDLESEQRLGVALLSPDDGCGTTRLSSIRLGSSNGDAAEPLELADTLELPADRWSIAATDRDHALLRHGLVYVLVHVDPSGALSLVGTRSSIVDLDNPQLLGQHVFGTSRFDSRRLDFTPAP